MMTDKRVSETELILPALYFINEESGITTSRLKSLLVDLLRPTGKDAEIARNRSDTYFEQKVRNLVSHRTLQRLGYAEYERLGNDGIHSITETGRSFLQTNKDALEYLFSGDFNYDDMESSFVDLTKIGEQDRKILIYDENLVIEEGTRRVRNIQVYERSKKLREAAINHYTNNGHLVCSVCSFDFSAVYGERGRGYIEIHHQKPIFQYEEQDTAKFLEQALQNVVPLCSNCHRMIHREKNAPMPVEELRHLIEQVRIYSSTLAR
jgi:5-methylcytosine-specific restriction endonuclease McrA